MIHGVMVIPDSGYTCYMEVNQIIKEVEKICRRHDVEHLFLFGSYASGAQTETSDIDFFIKGGRDIRGLKEETEQIKTLKKIDIFVYDDCQNPYLKEDMDRYGKEIY